MMNQYAAWRAEAEREGNAITDAKQLPARCARFIQKHFLETDMEQPIRFLTQKQWHALLVVVETNKDEAINFHAEGVQYDIDCQAGELTAQMVAKLKNYRVFVVKIRKAWDAACRAAGMELSRHFNIIEGKMAMVRRIDPAMIGDVVEVKSEIQRLSQAPVREGGTMNLDDIIEELRMNIQDGIVSNLDERITGRGQPGNPRTLRRDIGMKIAKLRSGGSVEYVDQWNRLQAEAQAMVNRIQDADLKGDMQANLATWDLQLDDCAAENDRNRTEGSQTAQLAQVDRLVSFAIKLLMAYGWVPESCPSIERLISFGYEPVSQAQRSVIERKIHASFKFDVLSGELYTHPVLLSSSRFLELCAGMRRCKNETSVLLISRPQMKFAAIALLYVIYSTFRNKAQLPLTNCTYHWLLHRTITGAQWLVQNTSLVEGDVLSVNIRPTDGGAAAAGGAAGP
jgi:hypothetical protein